MDFDSRRAWSRMPGINATNRARAELARAHGWQFADRAPWLLDRWPVLPFTQRGDMRLAYGSVAGAFHGIPFTAFEFFRRSTVLEKQALGITLNEHDRFATDTVWVLTLPAPMPFFYITSRDQVYFDTGQYPHPVTTDRKFNRRHRLVATDPRVAEYVLTPQVVSLVREARLGTWALVGRDLVHAENAYLGGANSQKVLEVLGSLATLISCLPRG